MVAEKAPPAGSGEKIEVTPAGTLSVAPADDRFVGAAEPNDGGPGPKSALKGGEGSQAQHDEVKTRKLRYSVQIHTDEKGLEVFEPIDADSGDAAAAVALAKKNYRGASVRGVTPYSDPDPNSLGGERDAAIMIGNANNDGAIINTLGTEANAETTKKLAKADIKDMGE